MKQAFDELLADCKDAKCRVEFTEASEILERTDGGPLKSISPEDLAERVGKGGMRRCLRGLIQAVHNSVSLHDRPDLRAVVKRATQYLDDSGKE